MLNGSHVEVGRQCAEVGYLHPPCESQDLTQVIRLGGGGGAFTQWTILPAHSFIIFCPWSS